VNAGDEAARGFRLKAKAFRSLASKFPEGGRCDYFINMALKWEKRAEAAEGGFRPPNDN
jgi:hypothetical protein